MSISAYRHARSLATCIPAKTALDAHAQRDIKRIVLRRTFHCSSTLKLVMIETYLGSSWSKPAEIPAAV